MRSPFFLTHPVYLQYLHCISIHIYPLQVARADAWSPCPACTDQATWLVRLSLDTGAADTLTPAAGQHVSVPRLTPDGNTIHSLDTIQACEPRRGSPLLPGQRDRDHRARGPRPHPAQHCQRGPGGHMAQQSSPGHTSHLPSPRPWCCTPWPRAGAWRCWRGRSSASTRTESSPGLTGCSSM